MTRRERYLTILGKGRADGLTWAPNFDHWLGVNTANGTVPAKYGGLSRNDIVRSVGATIWARAGMLRADRPNVRERREEEPGEWVRTTYETPVGSVQTLHRYASDLTRALFLTEHVVKRVEDVRVVEFMVRDTSYSLDSKPFLECEQQVGEDGISLASMPFCVPFIQFGKTDVGWADAYYLWNDYPIEVEALLEAYTDKAVEAAEVLSCGPGVLIQSGDNMDELTMPPFLFERYAVPYYRRISEILHRGGKLFQVHWCGRTKSLLPLVAGTGIDVIEAIATVPMTDLSVTDAIGVLRGQVVVQGGIPSVLMCEQGGSRDDLIRYVEDLLNRVPIGEWFVLGMGDNVPPDADFERVQMISDLVNAI